MPEATQTLRLLGERVQGHGFITRLITPSHGGPSFLRVINPEVVTLAEEITVCDADWFVWSWGEAMAPVDQIDDAAGRIVYVLTPQTLQNS